MNECDHTQAHYLEAFEGLLPGVEAEKILVHMRSCPACSKEISFLHALAEASLGLRSEEGEPSLPGPLEKSQGLGRPELVLGVAVAAAALLAIGLMVFPWGQATPRPMPVTSPTLPDKGSNQKINFPQTSPAPGHILWVKSRHVGWRMSAQQIELKKGSMWWVQRGSAPHLEADTLVSDNLVASVRVLEIKGTMVRAEILQVARGESIQVGDVLVNLDVEGP